MLLKYIAVANKEMKTKSSLKIMNSPLQKRRFIIRAQFKLNYRILCPNRSRPTCFFFFFFFFVFLFCLVVNVCEIKIDKYRPRDSMSLLFTSEIGQPPTSKHPVSLDALSHSEQCNNAINGKNRTRIFIHTPHVKALSHRVNAINETLYVSLLSSHFCVTLAMRTNH